MGISCRRSGLCAAAALACAAAFPGFVAAQSLPVLDVVVGIPGENSDGVSNSGRIALARGSGVGSSSQSLPSSMTAAFFGGTVTANGRFGQTVVGGDFNGDGFSDLAVGAPGQNQVFISYGALGPFQILSGSGDFGAALAVGDFNNDGRQDLAVGAPQALRTAPGGASVAAGAVHVFYGVAAGLSASPQTFDQGSLPVVADAGAEEAGDREVVGEDADAARRG